MSRNIIIKRILLILLGMVALFGNVCAHTTAFSLTKKGGKHFRHDFCNMQGGLVQFFPETKNDVGFTRLSLACHSNNNEEKEQAKVILKSLVYDLVTAGFANCLFGNGYIRVSPLKGTAYTNISIDFKWTSITSIGLIELK